MVGIDQRRGATALEKVWGLIKCGMSGLTKTLWRERQDRGGKSLQNLHSSNYTVVWAQGKVWQNAARSPARAVPLCSTSSIIAPELFLCVNNTATATEIHKRGKSNQRATHDLVISSLGKVHRGWYTLVQEKKEWHHRQNTWTLGGSERKRESLQNCCFPRLGWSYGLCPLTMSSACLLSVENFSLNKFDQRNEKCWNKETK